MRSLADLKDPTRGVATATAKSPALQWQQLLAQAIRSPAELCHRLGLSPTMATNAEQAAQEFPLLVPSSYLARIRPGDPRDPLLLQVLPQRGELDATSGFTIDPLCESNPSDTPGLLQKFHGRLLIMTTGECAVHCRFCFRRHFPFRNNPGRNKLWQSAVERISEDPSIEEIVFSGGDPLTIDDPELAELTWQLAAIPHLRRLRLHTRMPIVIPQRVTEELLGWLRGSRLTPIVVVHVNHPAEIDESAAQALSRLIDAGVPVLSQTVLLRGVNDDADVLTALYQRLIDLRVMPYYLHQLDRVAGTATFEVSTNRGLELIQALQARLPGYAVPRYVREVAGVPHKVILH